MTEEEREGSNGGGGNHPNASSEHELFLQEIEAVDDYWGPTFRAIYETDQHEVFIQKLEERIQDHDANIEKMCNFHYQGFISSVRDLLQVRSDAVRLNNEVVAIDNDLRSSSDKVIKKLEALRLARRVEKNIVSTMESLSSCLPVLQTFSKLSKQMSDKRYHPALKTLEQLEHTFLPRIANYRFSKQMRASIPKLRDSIKTASMTELKDFLEDVRKYSPKIGEIAMRKTAEKLNLDPMVLGEDSFERRNHVEPNPFTGEVDYEALSESTYDAEEDITAQDLVDFGPLYRCLHINTVLGEREDFEKYYRRQRSQQASLTLQLPINVHESVDSFKAYFHGIVGFFVCEDHVLNTGNELVSRAYLDEVWTGASVKVMSTFQAHFAYFTEAGFMLKIKNLMLLFASSLVGYGYSVDKLFVLLQELSDHYTEILMKKWVLRFREIFDSDNYHPIEITTPVDYANVTSVFPFENPAGEYGPIPKTFPFSAMVPRVYKEVKAFIDSCVKFNEDLNLSQSEIDESLRKSTNVLLTRTLSGCLSGLVRKNNLNLLQLIQININTYHLENTNVHLEKYISEITQISLEATHVARLQGRSMFKDIRAEAEDEINLKLISKMNEFIELANYDWLLPEARGFASPWLMDLIAFLKTVFQSFTNLPVKLAQMSCMSACQYLAKSIMNMILDDSVKAISLGILHQIDLDVVQCEMFAASEPVPDLEEDVLIMCFSDLRQLLNLFVSWDWTTYLADYGTGNDKAKYLRVQPRNALIIFDKLKEAEKKSHSFSIMNKKDRDKKKLVDTIYKQLKALTCGDEKGNSVATTSGGDLLGENAREEYFLAKNLATFTKSVFIRS